MIIISGSLLFEQGADLQPLKFKRDCNCKIYHVRFRLNIRDVFDDLQRFIKPFRPKTFNVMTAIELRKALAEILKELSAL